MRRTSGGLTVGIGARTDAISWMTARVAMTRPADVAASALRRLATTIVPIANATPMQSAATTTLTSVSLPSLRV